MKKTVSINLAGIALTIDEDAFDKLDQYLKSVTSYFADYEDADEIIADIEARAAEQLQERLQGRQVVSVADVEAVVTVMGTTHDFDNEYVAEEMDSSSDASQNNKKRLYRDTDEGMIGGVSSGLGAYFGIDPLIIRIAFVISIFFGGTGILAYIILWIAMPEAKTTAQKMAMQGEPVTLRGIEQAVKQRLKKKDSTQPGDAETHTPTLAPAARRFGEGIENIARKVVPVFLTIVGILVTIKAVLVLMALTVGSTFAFFAPQHVAVITEYVQTSSQNAWLYYGSAGLLLFILAAPFIVLLFAGISLVKRRWVMGSVLPGLLLLLWFVAVAVLGNIGFAHAENTREYIMEQYDSEVVTEDVTDSVLHYGSKDTIISVHANDSYTVSVRQGNEFSVSISGAKEMIKDTIIDIDQFGTLGIYQNEYNINWCFFCEFASPEVIVTLPTIPTDYKTFGAATIVVNETIAGDKVFVLTSGASTFEGKVLADELLLTAQGASALTVEGSANYLEADAQGAGSIDARAVTAQTAAVEASGASSISTSAEDTLKAEVSGSAHIDFYGDPVAEIGKSGAGEVTQKSREPFTQ